MTAPWQRWLTHCHGPLTPDAKRLCLFLTHNDGHLLADLFRHYRAMGDLQFIVVDDHSTDTSLDQLRDAPDVTVFQPLPGSTYARDKREWRGSLLDALADGTWCLVIDTDERLVWRGYPDRSLDMLISDLEAQGAEALIATMLDMYADCAIADHVATDAPLLDTFALFDDPRKDPLAYRTALTPKAFRAKFPFPNTMVMGGMRDRMFDAEGTRRSALVRWLQNHALTKPRHLPPQAMLRAAISTRLTRPRRAKPPLNLTKVPLLKWRAGLRYNGGAHHLSETLPPAAEDGVLLHFAITQGAKGISYTANRGQHAFGGSHYQAIVESGSLAERTPVYYGTSRLSDFADLDPFFGRNAP